MTEPVRSAPSDSLPVGYEGVLKSSEERRAELRRMRVIATSLLILMSMIYVATRLAPPDWRWAPYLGAFSEAGMVGACADWFAVVAIFRRPLGLPIPHTAVVPENKRRIGAALGRFIANNFLAPRVAIARLASVDVVGMAARWIEDERNARAITDGAARLAPHVIDALPKEALAEWVGMAARRGVEAVPVAPLASRALSILWAQGAAQTALDRSLDFVEETLARNKATIIRKVSQQSSRWIPKWFDNMVAAKVIAGLAGSLQEMRAPDHPWREQANVQIEKLIDGLAHDPEVRAQGKELKAQILANPVFARQTQALWEELKTSLTDDLPRHAEATPPGSSRRSSRSDTGLTKTRRAARESTARCGFSPCARCCRAGPKSAPISPRSSTIGIRRLSYPALSCRSEKTCNISASTARWSAASSAC